MRNLVTDLDGTLLNSEHIVSQSTIKTLKNFTEHQGEFVIATGRPYFEVEPILRSIKDPCPVISLNGAIIYDEEGHIIYTKSMETDCVFRIIKQLKGKHLNYDVVTSRSVYKVGSLNRLLEIYEATNQSLDLKLLANGIENGHVILIDENKLYHLVKEEMLDVYKIIVYSDNISFLEELSCELRETEEVEVTSSLAINIELNAVGVSKGRALTYLANHHGYSLQDFVSVGDGLNDLSMFQDCGLCVAMANGCLELQQHADIITLSNDENGVAELIKRVLLH